MATIILSAVGSAIGAGFGGTVVGLSGAVIGRAVGATLGRVIDQRLLGVGSQRVETGRVERFRLTGASEGGPVGMVWGRMRVGGQVIWASRFLESVNKSGGGKGAPKPRVVEYSYSVSLAIALCEGEIRSVGRIWADGAEIAAGDLNLRVYTGSEDQLPDPRIEAVEGAGQAPAYRGIAYVVIEDLALAQFGNRVPQFTFEVLRPAEAEGEGWAGGDLGRTVRAVAMMPGTGEYALATTPVHYDDGPGVYASANVNSASGKTDFATATEALTDELPNCGSVSLVVSWFGDDLRCGACTIRPKVEQTDKDGEGMPWRSGGIARAEAQVLGRIDDRPVYGGTPCDASVIEAIRRLSDRGQSVMVYPFILMDQLAGNGLTDPWTGAADQAALPWRGRITASVAPGLPGSPDGTAAAEAEVAAFFGSAQPGDFTVTGESVAYSGPDEWTYRRFILHQAHLAAAAGGVGAFCIGSEMRSLMQIRGTGGTFPAVAAMRALAADVRAVLGPGVKIGYAADWSEYYGFQDGTGDLYYHLDPLWADANIDFVGIDNYLPLSDWREGEEHADADWGEIYNLDYLRSNIEGGELYDWYYASDAARAVQLRTPITDGAYDEPWVWRLKDIRNWWANPHHDRVGGVRSATASPWVPQSKPVWFTEIGCAAIDKGTNEPNKFLDPKSSESSPPRYSDGRRDELIQMQYLRALIGYWSDPARNPVSDVYGGPMIDMERSHVWAWDARPYPWFPNVTDRWSDGENYARGHWIAGRSALQPLGAVIADICARSGVTEVDTAAVYGAVRGYSLADTDSARAALQPLMLAYGFEAVERDGALRFRMRRGRPDAVLDEATLVRDGQSQGVVETVRAPEAEIAGRVRLSYVEADGDFETRAAEAILPDKATRSVSHSELPLALIRSEAQRITERWLAEARIARDTARFALPPSMGDLGAGDIVTLRGERWRVDRVEQAGALAIEAVRVENAVYQPSDEAELRSVPKPFVAPVPVYPVFLDLPLLTGEEIGHAPHLAVTATPWPGSVAVYAATSDAGYDLNRLIAASSTIGTTGTALFRATPGLWDRGARLRVTVHGGDLASASAADVLNGANLAAIGDGSGANWEVIQFTGAEMVGTDTYELTGLLRGQAGSDGLMPDQWLPGSLFVRLDGAAEQVDMGLGSRGLARHYRIGPAARGYDDPSYVHRVEAFDGVGLRPYAPAHLRAVRNAGGNLNITWIRRTRIDGDSWASVEVPLGEEGESYLLRVRDAGGLRRELTVGAAAWIYLAAVQAGDGVSAPFAVEVAQVSQRFGPGLFRRITIND